MPLRCRHHDTLDRKITGLNAIPHENHLARMPMVGFGMLSVRHADDGTKQTAIALHARKLALLLRDRHR
jgi:hypothetical protein